MTRESLLSTGSTQKDPSRHNWKIVDWDAKYQTNKKIIYAVITLATKPITIMQSIKWYCVGPVADPWSAVFAHDLGPIQLTSEQQLGQYEITWLMTFLFINCLSGDGHCCKGRVVVVPFCMFSSWWSWRMHNRVDPYFNGHFYPKQITY